MAPPLKAESGDGGRGDAEPVVFEARHYTRGQAGGPDDRTPPLSADADKGDQDLLAFQARGGLAGRPRRLTPRECERLQGFPDDWTLCRTWRGKVRPEDLEDVAAWLGVPAEVLEREGATKDGPRYRALGNAVPVPVVRWILARLRRVAGGLAP